MLQDYLPALLRGAQTTLILALGSLALAIVFGFLGATAKLSGSRAWATLADGYTTVVRGVPEFVLMLLIFYGGQIAINNVSRLLALPRFELDALTTATLTIGLIFGGYFAESFRGAMLSVPKGQLEAAEAFGMTRWQRFSHVLLPQMARLVLPAAGNNWLVLLKSTAIASLIGLHDLMFAADHSGRSTQDPMTIYLAATAIYLLFTTASIAVLAALRKRCSRGMREGALE